MKISTKQMILVALFSALTAVGAFIKIPLGTVPVTMQFLFAALAGTLLGARLGAMSQIIYVVIGLLGVPIFASGSSGFAALSSTSFGYLIGFIFAAYIIGKITEKIKNPEFIILFFASMIGIIFVYSIGVPYLYLILKYVVHKNVPFSAVFKTGFIIFIPGDIIKCILVSALSVKIIPRIKRYVID